MQTKSTSIDPLVVPTPGLANLPLASFIPSSYLLGACISLACLGAILGLVYCPTLLDLPFAHMVNTWAGRGTLTSVVLYDIDQFPTYGGVTFLAVIWGCWFSVEPTEEDHLRSRLLAGVLVCIPAGVLSRFLQHRLHSHPRPFFDPALGFNPVAKEAIQRLNTWNSFPSDHATVLAALATVICLVRADLRIFIIPWLVIVEFARLYMGAHYPTDLLGGAALGAFMVFLAQGPWAVRQCRRLVALARTKPFLFYSLAFILTYQISTLFSDVRAIFQHQ